MTSPHTEVSRILRGSSFALLLSTVAQPGLAGGGSGDVYVLSNQPSGNSVMVYHRDADGTLAFSGSFASGGNGAGSGGDPLASQNPVALTANGRLLLAVNAGSDSITAFEVSGDQLTAVNTAPSGGTMPVSLAVRNGLVYVLNAGGTPNISGFTIDPKTNELTALNNSTQPLPGGASSAPAEVAFAPNEGVLMVTETATNNIDTFVLNSDGTPQTGVAFASSEPTPFGFAFRRGSRVAVISDAEGGAAGAAALSSYKVDKNGKLANVTGGVGDTQTGACWVVVTKDGRFAFTSNTGSGTISSYSVSSRGKLELLDVTAGSANVPIDMGLSHNGRYLYVRNAGDGSISGFRVRSDGGLKMVASASGLPDGAAGLAAF